MPQIDENKLNEYADAVFDRCNYFNDYVLETIGRRIKATGQLSAADQAALKNMADISGDMDAITKKLAEITGQNIADIEDIYTQVLTDGVNTYEPLYDLKGMTFLPFEQNEFAKQLVRHWAAETAGELVNLSRTKALCFDRYNLAGEVIGSTPLAGAFQKAIDDAVIAVSTGTVDFNTAMRKTVEQLGGSGVKVHYGSGVNRSLSAMVRQNLLYGAKRASQAYEEQVGKELGCDGFEVDYHAHPRPSHAFMGGRMYSYKGTVRIGGRVYEDGAEALERLSDYGCLHFKTDVILGISEPRYDEAWLSAQKRKDAEPIAFDGRQKTAYEWQQVQRELERAVRRENSTAVMARASGDKVLARRCREKTAAYREKYDALCDAVGLEKRYNRMAAYGAKAVDNAEKRGIIEVKSNNAGENMRRSIKTRSANGLRGSASRELNETDIENIKKHIIDIHADLSVFRFNSGVHTSYVDDYDIINIRGDVFPDKSSTHPRDLMSEKAVLAHEYYGHRANRGTKLQCGAWNDEFRASYMAARDCPNLSDEDRRYLLLDAIERAKEAGVSITYNSFMRRVLYGY